jgi:hypothetical protein
MSTSFNTKIAAETNLTDGQLKRVMQNGEEIPKLRGRTRIPVASKVDTQPQKTQKLVKYNGNNNNNNNNGNN